MWKEFEVSNFLGIASSNRHPQKNECQECKNFDTRYIDGDLTLRAGFSQKYAAPASADYRGKLSSITWLEFENFIPEGTTTEVTIWVAKATLAGETAIANTEVAELAQIASKNIIALFSSHQYINGSWVTKNYDGVATGKYWLNQTFVTSIGTTSTGSNVILDCMGTTTLTGSIDTTASVNVTGVLTLFLTELKVGDRILVGAELRVVATITTNTALTVTIPFTDQGNDPAPKKLLNFDGWTIINVSKSPDEVAQVIETYDAGSGQLGVRVTNNSHSWTNPANPFLPDVIVLMRNYIPWTALQAMHSCVANDITFHKVLNDLRIGFGGQANRIALSVGYRKSYLPISVIDFGSFSSFYEPLSTINNLIVDTYTPVQDDGAYKIEIGISGGTGQVAIGKYFFKLTGLLDGFNEVLLAENDIELSTTQRLIVRPLVKAGAMNKRITKFRLYVSVNAITDSIAIAPYYYLSEVLFQSTSYAAGPWGLNEDGYLYVTDYTELHAAGDPTTPTTDGDTLTSFSANWTNNPAGTELSADHTDPEDGLHWLKAYNDVTSGAITAVVTYTQLGLIKAGKNYRISVYGRTDNTVANLEMNVKITSTVNFDIFLLKTGLWNGRTKVIAADADSDTIIFTVTDLPNGKCFGLDLISIKEIVNSEFGDADIPVTINPQEMTDKLGYEPTFDMVRSWDQAIVTQGRTFVVNPYIDKRYENKIFKSAISGAGAFMYDAISAAEYIDLENFDGNTLVGVEVLPNLQLIALRINGTQRVDPDTGATRQISLGKGCNSRKSIVNFGDKVAWTNDDDIYASDSMNVISIADKYIREEYRALVAGLSGLKTIAIRESKDNAYRFLMPTPAYEREYILTKKGWVTRENAGSVIPDAYSNAQDGTVWMMDAGVIYGDATTSLSLDNVTTIPASWKSTEFGAELLGESVDARDFILLNEVWVDCTIYDSLTLDLTMTITVYCDGSSYKSFTHIATHTPASNYGRQEIFKRFTPKNCRRFYVAVSVVATGASTTGVLGKSVLLHSVGVMLDTIKVGIYN